MFTHTVKNYGSLHNPTKLEKLETKTAKHICLYSRFDETYSTFVVFTAIYELNIILISFQI